MARRRSRSARRRRASAPCTRSTVSNTGASRDQSGFVAERGEIGGVLDRLQPRPFAVLERNASGRARRGRRECRRTGSRRRSRSGGSAAASLRSRGGACSRSRGRSPPWRGWRGIRAGSGRPGASATSAAAWRTPEGRRAAACRRGAGGGRHEFSAGGGHDSLATTTPSIPHRREDRLRLRAAGVPWPRRQELIARSATRQTQKGASKAASARRPIRPPSSSPDRRTAAGPRRPGGAAARPWPLRSGSPSVFHTSTSASTSPATCASVWRGVGVMRSRSVPLATVG